MDTTRLEYFFRHVQITDTCWLWTAHINKLTGYGRFGWWAGGKQQYDSHRYLWEYINGPVPSGLELDHLCRVKHCVNPDHLEPVTHKENNRRGMSPTAVNARKTHCPAGHPYSDDNLVMDGGGRKCRICKNARQRRYTARLGAVQE